MPDVGIALVNTMKRSSSQYYFGSENPGLMYIYTALEESGFDGMGLFPYVRVNKREAGCTDIAKSVADCLKGREVKVVGISATADNYPDYLDMVDALRREVPDALFVGGGRLFIRDKTEPTDPISHELDIGNVDCAVDGNCKPFVDLCTSLRDGAMRYDGELEGDLPEGLYTKRGGRLMDLGKVVCQPQKCPSHWCAEGTSSDFIGFLMEDARMDVITVPAFMEK